MQNYALFRFLQLLRTLFFNLFARKFINSCVSGMFYGRFSGMRERKPGGVLNILSRACRCARVWTVWKKAGKVKIPAGWSEKYLWKDGILYRMTRKKSENTPRGMEKMFVRAENSFQKMWIFPLKSPGKSTKMMKTGRKISFPAREKT